MSIEKRLASTAEEVAKRYSELSSVRAAVQMIPYVGGPLDTLLGGFGAKLVQERQAEFLHQLHLEMSRLNKEKVDEEFLSSEEFLDFLLRALTWAVRTSRTERIALLARAVSSAACKDWGRNRIDDAEALLDLAASLNVEDVRTLHVFVERYTSVPTEVGEDWDQNDLRRFKVAGLEEYMKDASERTLMRLQARGLIREIVGTYLNYAGGAYRPTILGIDLIEFLRGSSLSR